MVHKVPKTKRSLSGEDRSRKQFNARWCYWCKLRDETTV